MLNAPIFPAGTLLAIDRIYGRIEADVAFYLYEGRYRYAYIDNNRNSPIDVVAALLYTLSLSG